MEGSVSKGVFSFKGRKKVAHPGDYFHDEKKTEDAITRMGLCDDLWENIHDKIQVMQAEMNSKIFDELLTYVKDAKSNIGNRSSSHSHEIPTAALVTGVNMPDHGVMFGNLVTLLQENVTPHIALLKSKDCPNVKSIMSRTLSQLMGGDNVMDDEEDEEIAGVKSQVNLKKISCTMSVLSEWYRYHVRQRSRSPTKRSPVKRPFSSPSKQNKRLFSPESPPSKTTRRNATRTPRKGEAPSTPIKSPRKQNPGLSSPCTPIKSPRKNPTSAMLQTPTKSPRKEPVSAMMMSPGKSPRKDAKTAMLKTPTKEVARNLMNSPPTNTSKEESSSGDPPIVIVLEDLEGFTAKVLQDFITICSNHIKDLPIVLVFGIATAVTAVHKVLPHAVSSLLCMEKFQAPPSSEYLSLVIQQVLMTDAIPFKLGHKVFSLLLDLFLFHDFSVLNFIRGLQFALIEHFHSSPGSILCQNLEESLKAVEHMTHKELQNLTTIPSLSSYIEGKSDKERQTLKQHKPLKEMVRGLLERLDSYHQNYFPMLRCLHMLASTLPKYPLGRQVREIYTLNLSAHICDTDEYKEAEGLLKSLSRDELLSQVQQCVQHLSESKQKKMFTDDIKQLNEFIYKFENIEELSKQADEEEKANESKEDPLLPKKKMDMYTLRKTLQEMEKKKKKLSLYEVFRKETIDFFNQLFRKYLVCPTSLPLHEVFYYNSAAELRRQINGSPRATIQKALSEPYCYLKNEELLCDDSTTILPNLPDVCIVYKLHLECGKFINLFDWLQAFITVVEAGDEEAENLGDMRKPDKVMQARFIRAVSELQYMGFIKPTKRKTDHVSRLTWGGC